MAQPPSRSQRQLLEKVFTTALDRGFDPVRAETYGVWILCFARYCEAHNVDPPAAAQVPNFMAYLVGRSDLTAEERENALDAVMFALTEVPDAFVSGAPPERTLPAHGASSTSGYAANAAKTPGGHALTHLLLETDVGLYDAVRLRIHDVDRDERVLHVGSNGSTRQVPLTDSLLSDLGAAARRAVAHGSRHLFPEAYDKYVAPTEDAESSGEDAKPTAEPPETDAAPVNSQSDTDRDAPTSGVSEAAEPEPAADASPSLRDQFEQSRLDDPTTPADTSQGDTSQGDTPQTPASEDAGPGEQGTSTSQSQAPQPLESEDAFPDDSSTDETSSDDRSDENSSDDTDDSSQASIFPSY